MTTIIRNGTRSFVALLAMFILAETGRGFRLVPKAEPPADCIGGRFAFIERWLERLRSVL